MGAAESEAEFVAFVRARQQSLVQAAVLLTGDAALAQDLVQEALIKLAAKWESVARGAEYAYVRRTLYRDAVSRWRKHRREQLHAAPGELAEYRGSGHIDPIGDWQAGEPVRQALAQLPPRQRAVVVLRYYEDLSERQIAETLGVTEGTVKSQASAALAKLRQWVPELEPSVPNRKGESR